MFGWMHLFLPNSGSEEVLAQSLQATRKSKFMSVFEPWHRDFSGAVGQAKHCDARRAEGRRAEEMRWALAGRWQLLYFK
jgi:hypothetical protein